jgi:hypothetical protein
VAKVIATADADAATRRRGAAVVDDESDGDNDGDDDDDGDGDGDGNGGGGDGGGGGGGGSTVPWRLLRPPSTFSVFDFAFRRVRAATPAAASAALRWRPALHAYVYQRIDELRRDADALNRGFVDDATVTDVASVNGGGDGGSDGGGDGGGASRERKWQLQHRRDECTLV